MNLVMDIVFVIPIVLTILAIICNGLIWDCILKIERGTDYYKARWVQRIWFVFILGSIALLPLLAHLLTLNIPMLMVLIAPIIPIMGYVKASKAVYKIEDGEYRER